MERCSVRVRAFAFLFKTQLTLIVRVTMDTRVNFANLKQTIAYQIPAQIMEAV